MERILHRPKRTSPGVTKGVPCHPRKTTPGLTEGLPTGSTTSRFEHGKIAVCLASPDGTVDLHWTGKVLDAITETMEQEILAQTPMVS